MSGISSETTKSIEYHHPCLKKTALVLASVMLLLCLFPLNPELTNLSVLIIPLLIMLIAFLMNKKLVVDKPTMGVYLFLLLWLTYSLTSCMWARDLTLAINFTQRIIVYLLLFSVLTQLFRNKELLDQIPLFFQIVIYSYCLIYVWEMITWKHLPSSRLYGVSLPVPTGPYYNENNSAVFLMLLSPLLSVRTVLTSSKTGKIVAITMFFFIMVGAFLQSSRLALAFMILIGGFYYFKAGYFVKLASFLLLILPMIVFIYGYPAVFKTTSTLALREIKSTLNENKSYLQTSTKIRTALNEHGLKFALQSGFFGIGAGNFETYMSKLRYYDSGRIVNPHNWWIELLADFGFGIFFTFCAIYLIWVIKLIKRSKLAQGTNTTLYQAALISLLLFIPLSIIPSSIKDFYGLWIYFAFIHSLSLTKPNLPPKSPDELIAFSR